MEAQNSFPMLHNPPIPPSFDVHCLDQVDDAKHQECKPASQCYCPSMSADALDENIR